MSKLEQAARQALEALHAAKCDDDGWHMDANTAITALREALASCRLTTTEQAEQEPVAWANPLSLKEFEPRDENIHHRLAAVADRNIDGFLTPLYAAPVRTKDLTDDEIQTWLDALPYDPHPKHLKNFARAVIAADREKNNPLTKSNKGE